MKKKLWLIPIICMLIGVCLTACNQDGGQELVGERAIAANVRFGATPLEELSSSKYEEQYSFKDEEHWYFVYYLGVVDHVPLQNNATVYEYSGHPFTKEFSTTVTSAESVSDMVSTVDSHSVSEKVDVRISSQVSAGIDGLGARIEAGMSTTTGVENKVSAEKSYTEAAEYSQTNQDRTTFTFHEDYSEPGFYRYILMGDVDVFGVLIYEPATDTYDQYTYKVVKSQYFVLDYSKTSDFSDNQYEELVFELSENDIASLREPQKTISEAPDIPDPKDPIVQPKPEITDKYEYASPSKAIKIDASEEVICDTLDLGGLSAYLNDGYTLHFKVVVTMKEENSGYQEVYLCDDTRAHIAGESAYEHGGKGDPNETYMDATFYWDVSGEQCTRQMYLSYGAHGEHSDDWYRKQAKVTVTVSQK